MTQTRLVSYSTYMEPTKSSSTSIHVESKILIIVVLIVGILALAAVIFLLRSEPKTATKSGINTPIDPAKLPIDFRSSYIRSAAVVYTIHGSIDNVAPRVSEKDTYNLILKTPDGTPINRPLFLSKDAIIRNAEKKKMAIADLKKGTLVNVYYTFDLKRDSQGQATGVDILAN